MPLYMDRHQSEGVTAKAVAEAHEADRSLAGKYGCKFITYWFDQTTGAVFCLVEAPNTTAARKTHEEAHGSVPSEIIEVDPDVVLTFLGRTQGFYPTPNEKTFDSPFRTIMFTNLERSTEKIAALGDTKWMELLRDHNALTRNALRIFGGQEIKHTGDGFMTSFHSAVSAVNCAMAIQQAFRSYNEEHPTATMNIRIGISAGEPVYQDKDLFGAAVNLATQLCTLANPGTILVPQVVRDLCLGNTISFVGRGNVTVKGFHQSVTLFEVDWRNI